MSIQVTEISTQDLSGTRYTYVTMQTDKHTALVLVAKGKVNYVRVIIQNAMNRAWRGMGKQFPTVADAVANYKTDAIRNMIEHAAEVAA